MVWQLWFSVGVVVFGTLCVWDGVKDRLPNSRFVHKLMPAGLPLAVLLLAAGDRIGKWLESRQPDPGRRLLDGLVFLALPTIVVTVLTVVGRTGERPTTKWWHRFAGLPLVPLLGHFMFGWF